MLWILWMNSLEGDQREHDRDCRQDLQYSGGHIDGGDYPHLDSNDIINLPYENNSVDLIYASHVIEYFDREEVITHYYS